MSEPSAIPDPAPTIEADEPAEPVLPPGPGVVAAIVWLVLFFVVQVPFFVVSDVFLDIGRGLYLPLTTMGIFFAALLILRLRQGRHWRRTLALRGLNWTHAVCVLLLVPVLFVLYAPLDWALKLAYRAAGVSDSALNPYAVYGDFVEFLGEMPMPLAALYVMVFFGALPGIGEELYFRGFVGRGLVAQRGVLLGVLLTSLLFGVMHLHPFQSVATAVVGIVMHVLFLWSRSLSASILYHVTHNCANAALMLVLESVPQESLPTLLAAPEPPWPLVVAAGLSVATLGWFYHRTRVQWRLPDGALWWPGYFDTAMPPAELNARAVAGQSGKRPGIVAALAYAVFIAVLGQEIIAE
jgi:membrane protease YdiL (CAAX protease family)